jgi:phage recombination protein Bet
MSTEIIQAALVTDKELTMHLENLGLLKDLTAGEKNTYLQIAKAYNLNPFKREVHVSKYGNQMSIITGYEVYIKRAERTGQLDGWNVTTEGTVAANDLKAIVTIHRKDRSHPFVWEAEYSEYVQMKDDKPNKFWMKAKTMIKKVAISQGFRLCFSDELGGMPYTADEVQTEDVTPVVVETKFIPTQDMLDKADQLIKNSTLDENARIKAANSIANVRTANEWTKIIARLNQVQTADVVVEEPAA